VTKTNEERAIERANIIATAERNVLDKLCGMLQNVGTLLELKLRQLRMEAGRSPSDDSVRSSHLPERDAALMIVHQLHSVIADNYPDHWDEMCLPPDTDFDFEQLRFDLRKKVRSAIARSFA
jgi:hypothetical protein